MNEQIREALNRLKQTIERVETLGASQWSAGLGTAHLAAWADQIVNDAKTVGSHMKAYGKK